LEVLIKKEKLLFAKNLRQKKKAERLSRGTRREPKPLDTWWVLW